jgi:hypothetical protein
MCNTENVEHEVDGLSLRRCGRIKPDVVWDMHGKVIQSNAIFGLTDRLQVFMVHMTSGTRVRGFNPGRSRWIFPVW